MRLNAIKEHIPLYQFLTEYNQTLAEINYYIRQLELIAQAPGRAEKYELTRKWSESRLELAKGKEEAQRNAIMSLPNEPRNISLLMLEGKTIRYINNYMGHSAGYCEYVLKNRYMQAIR